MNSPVTRIFEAKPAIRSQVPLLIGIVGPSGSGKTKSALRLATGIQRVTGGEVYGVDTEADRMLHYADDYPRLMHVPFGAPFDALSYLAAVEYCVKKGAKTVILDSASHLHEGAGGTLEMHEAECERLQKAWARNGEPATRDKVQMAAWQRPKQELRKFLNTVLQMKVNTIWCFRAKDKLKIVPGKQPQVLGFMPIAGDEMIYEMTLNCLLYPNSGGVPSWHPEEMGERAVVKLPQQFKALFAESKPLDEDIGQKLAEWAAGSPPITQEDIDNLMKAYTIIGPTDKDVFAELETKRSKYWGRLTREQKSAMSDASKAAQKKLETT